MPVGMQTVLVIATPLLALSPLAHADPGVWTSSTFTLDSFCLANAQSPEGSELISGIGEGFDVGISNFAFATLTDLSAAATSSGAFSRFGPNAGMPKGDRLIIEGFSNSRLSPEPNWTDGRAFGRSSVRVDFSLPFGGRFRVLDGWIRTDSTSSSANISLGNAGTTIFAYDAPEDSPAGNFGVLPPGNWALFFGSTSQTTLDSPPGLSTEASYAFDLQLLANASCPGDFDTDSQIDDADFVPFVVAYNLLDCSDPSMPLDCPADLDFSGWVDDADFILFAGAYDVLLCP